MPRTIKDVAKVAEERGWCLNPDTKQVNNLIKAENMLREKFGDYYCPCKVKKIPENVCPCEGSTREIEKDGHCHCQMYYKCEDQ